MALFVAGLIILRLTLGILILLHSIAKLLHGIGSIQGTVTGMGLPALFAYGVYVGEVLAPLMLILGFYARIGAALIAVNMLFAFMLVHTGDLTSPNQTGDWALELQGMFLFTAVALMLLGPGRIGLDRQ